MSRAVWPLPAFNEGCAVLRCRHRGCQGRSSVETESCDGDFKLMAAHEHEHHHDHQVVPSDPALRTKALESLLVEKGLVDRAALDALVDAYENKIGPRNGARVVARAWVDPAYKERLLNDAAAAIAELGYGAAQGEHMVVLENSPGVHNLVVCTLCSCYPWPILGLPPVWYKSAPYRSRSVIDPRGVLREFGLELPQDVEVRVSDSTAEIRYLVLPERPAGTEKMTEQELADLVTRDAMIGVAKVASPPGGEA
jgi:nitrile hydratase